MCQIQQKPRSYCGKNRNDKKNWDLHRLFQYFMSEPIEAIEKKREKGRGKKEKGSTRVPTTAVIASAAEKRRL